MKIALLGYGKMGKEIEKAAREKQFSIVNMQEADVCIDFSHKSCVLKHAEGSLSLKKPLVIGTTGWYDQLPTLEKFVKKWDGSVVYGENFSIGMHYFMDLLEKAFALLKNDYAAHLEEIHHKEKIDSPSGTALRITQLASDQNIPIKSIRRGKVFGIHRLAFDSSFDTITLHHKAKNRRGWAEGALLAAKWIQDKKGLFRWKASLLH